MKLFLCIFTLFLLMYSFIVIILYKTFQATYKIDEILQNIDDIQSGDDDIQQSLYDDMVDETIFVSIASYRDSKCSLTLNSLFQNAKYPQRINVGICQQNDEKNDSHIECFNPKYKSRIRMLRLPHYEAKGPTWARYLCSKLWNGETYYFQIDSHTLFRKDWDVRLINMIKELKKRGIKKPLISHYPKIDADIKKQDNDNTVTTICKGFFNHQDMISLEGAHIIPVTDFKPTAYVAGGMFFAESKFLNEVPFDPNLPYLFTGEEILHSVRFWTNGWDIFTPNENIIYHYYTRSDEPKVWNDSKTYNEKDAFDKVMYILKLKDIKLPLYMMENIDKYGVGNVRTLEQYFEYAGINVKEKKFNRNFCYDKNIPEIFKKYSY